VFWILNFIITIDSWRFSCGKIIVKLGCKIAPHSTQKYKYKNQRKVTIRSFLINIITINRIPVMAPILAPLLGLLFYGGISPSKIGLIAPYWEPVQALSKARVFLLGWKNFRLVCIALTDGGISPHVIDYGRGTFFNAHQRCRIIPGTCIMAKSVARLKIISIIFSNSTGLPWVSKQMFYQSKLIQPWAERESN
jgi:hypothetical protein